MTRKLDYYRPDIKDPSTVIFAPYTYAGHEYNTGGRLQYLAKKSGALVIGTNAPGTGRVHITSSERRSLQPDTFNQTAASYAEDIAPVLANFDKRLGLGDSGRGILIARMQLAGRPFTHVLLRDCVNLVAAPHKPEPFRKGALRVLRQPSKGLINVPPDAQQVIDDFQATHEKPGIGAFLNGPAEMWALGNLMCSDMSARAVLDLAGDAQTAMRYVDFNHGLSGAGSADRSLVFKNQLVTARAQAIDRLSRFEQLRLSNELPTDNYSTSGFSFTLEYGNHGDITNPGLLVTHADQTLAFGTAV